MTTHDSLGATGVLDSAEPLGPLGPLDLGVGARLTLSVMSDDYADILLGALDEARATAFRETTAHGLVIESDPVSTYVGGAEAEVLTYVGDLIARVSASGAHVVAHVQLSRGCPGELTCGLDAPTLAIPDLAALPVFGVQAAAQWALYPLADGAGSDHMSHINTVIAQARAAGIAQGSRHFVTELAGDLGEVLFTVAQGWLAAGRSVAHVVTHVTISTNHPCGESASADSASTASASADSASALSRVEPSRVQQSGVEVAR